MMALLNEWLDVLACPKCKGSLSHLREQNELWCESCCLTYEVKDDIPILTVDSAKAHVRGALEPRRSHSADGSSMREEGSSDA